MKLGSFEFSQGQYPKGPSTPLVALRIVIIVQILAKNMIIIGTWELTPTVHVVVCYILRAQRVSDTATLGPKCMPYSYTDPLG